MTKERADGHRGFRGVSPPEPCPPGLPRAGIGASWHVPAGLAEAGETVIIVWFRRVAAECFRPPGGTATLNVMRPARMHYPTIIAPNRPARIIAWTVAAMWHTWQFMRGLAIIARTRPARITGWTPAAILALAAVVAYGVALWRAPGWMHATTAQDRYNARVLVISVGGAIVVGTGLLYTARNYRLSRRGQVTAAHHGEHAR